MEQEAQLDILPWYMVAGDDGLMVDAIFVATMHGEEMQTVSLHVAKPPMTEE